MSPSDSDHIQAFQALGRKTGWTVFSAIVKGGIEAADTLNLLTGITSGMVCTCGSCSLNAKSDMFPGNIKTLVNCLKTRNVRVVYLHADADATDDPATRLFMKNLLAELPTNIAFYLSQNTRGELIAPSHTVLTSRLTLSEPTNFVRSFNSCLSTLSPNGQMLYPRFSEFWQSNFKCSLADDNPALPLCPVKIADRKSKCRCTKSESLFRPFGIRDALIYDAALAALSGFSAIKTVCQNQQEFCKDGAFYRLNATTVLSKISFEGITGKVAFQSGLRKKTGATFDYMFNGVSFGRYDVEGQKIVTLTLPANFPVSTLSPESHFTSTSGLVVNSLALILLLLTFYFALTITKHRDHRVIQLSRISFLYSLLAGVFLASTAIILFSMQTSTIMCNMRIWLLLLSASVIMG